MVRQKAEDSQVSQKVRDVVYIINKTGLPASVIFSVLGMVAWAGSWVGPNILLPAAEAYTKQGPLLLSQSMKNNEQLGDLIKGLREDSIRQRIIEESNAENQRTALDILRRIDARIKP